MTSGKRLLAKVAPYAKIVRGVAHPHRLAILYLLAHDPTWPEDLGRHLPLPQNLIAHHLKEMVSSGWLKKRRTGKHVTYMINKKIVKQLPFLLADTPFWKNLTK